MYICTAGDAFCRPLPMLVLDACGTEWDKLHQVSNKAKASAQSLQPHLLL